MSYTEQKTNKKALWRTRVRTRVRARARATTTATIMGTQHTGSVLRTKGATLSLITAVCSVLWTVLLSSTSTSTAAFVVVPHRQFLLHRKHHHQLTPMLIRSSSSSSSSSNSKQRSSPSSPSLLRAETVANNNGGDTIATGTTPTVAAATTVTATKTEGFYWNFREQYEVYAQKTTIATNIDNQDEDNDNTAENTDTKKVVSYILIHGFGCSTTYWRQTIQTLLCGSPTATNTVPSSSSSTSEVHAVDLLGLGQSSKPNRHDDQMEYSIDIWAEQVQEYIRKYIPRQNEIILIGNSLGSTVALSVATHDFENNNANNDSSSSSNNKSKQTTTNMNIANTNTNTTTIKGIVMYNCGVGLNSRGIANDDRWDPVQKALIHRGYDVLCFLIFKNTRLLTYALTSVITREKLQAALTALYVHTPTNVDRDLVDSFYIPTQTPSVAATVDVLSQIYCNPPGKTPMQYHQLYPEIIGRYLPPTTTITTPIPTTTTATTMHTSEGSNSNNKTAANDDDAAVIPIHLIWGTEDVVTPIEGGVGSFYTNMANNNIQNNKNDAQHQHQYHPKVTMTMIRSGHIPFDDNPIAAGTALVEWLETIL